MCIPCVSLSVSCVSSGGGRLVGGNTPWQNRDVSFQFHQRDCPGVRNVLYRHLTGRPPQRTHKWVTLHSLLCILCQRSCSTRITIHTGNMEIKSIAFQSWKCTNVWEIMSLVLGSFKLSFIFGIFQVSFKFDWPNKHRKVTCQCKSKPASRIWLWFWFLAPRFK